MITKKALPRRTFLRGMGTAVALPFLDAMVPALAAPRSSNPPVRMAFVYVPNGIIMDGWNPDYEGKLGELRSEEHTSELQSLRHLVCRLLLEKKKKKYIIQRTVRICQFTIRSLAPSLVR